MKNIFSIAAGEEFSIWTTAAWVKGHPGNHTLLIALAKNNNVLYSTEPAKLAITVK